MASPRSSPEEMMLEELNEATLNQECRILNGEFCGFKDAEANNLKRMTSLLPLLYDKNRRSIGFR
jgi:hypothetical protein